MTHEIVCPIPMGFPFPRPSLIRTFKIGIQVDRVTSDIMKSKMWPVSNCPLCGVIQPYSYFYVTTAKLSSPSFKNNTTALA